jgi:hypothetical protein
MADACNPPHETYEEHVAAYCRNCHGTGIEPGWAYEEGGSPDPCPVCSPHRTEGGPK